MQRYGKEQRQSRSITFPQAFSVGTITYLVADKLNESPAQGTCSFLWPVMTGFKPNYLTKAYPQLFNSFHPDFLHSLNIDLTNKRIPELVPAIARLTGLRKLEFSDTYLSADDLRRLEALVNLQELQVRNCEVAGRDMAKSALLKNIVWLTFERLDDSSPVVSVLSQSKKLVGLNLSQCQLSHADIVKIARLSNLRDLQLKSTNIDDDDLIKLGTLKKLSSLNLEACNNLTPDCINTLKTFKSLRDLYLPSRFRSPRIRRALKQALPNLKDMHSIEIFD